MISLAKWSIRRPKTALAIWLLVAAGLVWLGFGVTNTMSPTITVVKGTESARAQTLADAQFGQSQLVPILLEGDRAQLNSVGPKLAVALRQRPHMRVLSAWDKGSGSAGLRPRPNAGMIVVAVDRSEKDVVKYDQPQIEKLVTTTIGSTPVKAYVTGQPSIDRALKDASVNKLRHTELIAAGILFVLLLLGLRAPVAALIVTLKGTISMLAAFGEVALLGHFIRLDNVGVAAGSMTGLAVGVGFALLILDRFHREQEADGLPARDEVTAAMRQLNTTGKAVLVGGTGLIIALGLVAVVGPTELMVSVGAAALTSAAFATGAAVVVMPAVLVLLGRHINLLRFPAPSPLERLWSRLLDGGNWVTRHAIYAGFAATAILAALAVPALGLKFGQESVKQLPTGAGARIAFQEVSKVMGPGWATPYGIIVVANNRPITTPALLASIATFQSQIKQDPRVAAVAGPGSIAATSKQLSQFGPGLKKSVALSNKSKRDLLKLIEALGQAGAGSNQLKTGLTQAASGSGQIASGSGQLQSGAGQLAAGLLTAKAGASSGFTQVLDGVRQLQDGAGQALAGAQTLGNNIGQSQGGVPDITGTLNGAKNSAATAKTSISTAAGQAATASSAIAAAEQQLAAINDPAAASAKNALAQAAGVVSGLSRQISSAQSSASNASTAAANAAYSASGLSSSYQSLRDNTNKLAGGISQIKAGDAKLSSGVAGGAGQLQAGFNQLIAGANQIQYYLGVLTTGARQLASGLAAAPGGAGQLADGLAQMQSAVSKSQRGIPSTKDLETLFKQAPGMFKSGYFVLAAVEGARGFDRNAATFAINLLRGGTAGQIIVTSRYASGSPQSEALRKQLVAISTTFANNNNAEVAVGGPGGNLSDLTNQTKAKIWLDVAVIAVALALVLAVALRAIVLPLVTVAFNLLVVTAAFGIVELLFGGPNPTLGGPGYLDPVTTISIFTVAFGISVSYSTLLLMRTREAYLEERDGREAVATGLRQTAAAATGAGLAMVAAVIPFAATELINVRELGVGVGAAILFDVLLLRPVLLPAAASMLGRFGWWPTSGQRPSGPPAQATRRRLRIRLPHVHVPHRAPRPAS